MACQLAEFTLSKHLLLEDVNTLWLRCQRNCRFEERCHSLFLPLVSFYFDRPRSYSLRDMPLQHSESTPTRVAQTSNSHPIISLILQSTFSNLPRSSHSRQVSSRPAAINSLTDALFLPVLPQTPQSFSTSCKMGKKRPELADGSLLA